MSTQRPDYHTQISREACKAYRAHDAEACVYYAECLGYSASASWKTFRGSWAYDAWRCDHQIQIAAQQAEFQRFSFMA
jgi:hypothetical protein